MLGAVCGFGGRIKEHSFTANVVMNWWEMMMDKKTYPLSEMYMLKNGMLCITSVVSVAKKVFLTLTFLHQFHYHFTKEIR